MNANVDKKAGKIGNSNFVFTILVLIYYVRVGFNFVILSNK